MGRLRGEGFSASPGGCGAEAKRRPGVEVPHGRPAGSRPFPAPGGLEGGPAAAPGPDLPAPGDRPAGSVPAAAALHPALRRE